MLDDEGADVSAREKPLVTIARAFLARSSVLILDEATSSADTRTEALVQKVISALRSYRFRSRMSTSCDADLNLSDGSGPDRGAGHAGFAAPCQRGPRAAL